MQKYQNNVTNRKGDAISGATVTITTLLGALATIYSDDEATVQANPMATDALGYFSFYAANGRYNITVAGLGISTTTYGDVLFEDDESALDERVTIAALATPSALAVGGYTAAEAQSILDNALPMQSYTALRAYTGRASGVRITSAGVAGLFWKDTSDTTSLDNGGTIIVDASARRWKRLFSGAASVRWFGAVGDDVADDTAAFNAALLACLDVWTDTPSVAYRLLGSVNITRDGNKLRGPGVKACTLKGMTNNIPVINVNTFLTNWELSGFTITGGVVPIAGGNGIYAPTSMSQAFIHDIEVNGRWDGFVLGSTDYSRIQNCNAQDNYHDGFVATNGALVGASALQWNFSSCLAQRNNRMGYNIFATAGPAAVALGAMERCDAFANGSYGLSVVGLPGVPIHGLRLFKCFIGQDANHEIHLDTYGGLHTLDSCFVELAGTGTTGIGHAQAASNVGNGFSFTANNRDITVVNCRAEGNSYNGLISQATTVSIQGGSFTTNGRALVASNRNGVFIFAGRAVISGVISGAFGSAGQLYGVVAQDGTNLSIIGCDLTGNVTAPLQLATNGQLTTVIGNLPTTVQTSINAGGGMAIGNVAPGAAGAVNVQTNVLKNGVVYTNP